MKVWILYDEPFDDGWNVYGVFSSEDKAEKARDIFSSKSTSELLVGEFGVDALERFFEKSLSPSRLYTAWRHGDEWDIRPANLDSFLCNQGEERKDFMMSSGRIPSATVHADSPEQAKEKLEHMYEELVSKPADERGWKWVER